MPPEPISREQRERESREAARSLYRLLSELRGATSALEIVVNDAIQNPPHGEKLGTLRDDSWEAIMGMTDMLARDMRQAYELANTADLWATPEPIRETPIARLWRQLRAVQAETVTTDAESDARLDRLNDLEMQIAEAPAQTPRDMAMKIWLAREYLQNNGAIFHTILDDAAETIGADAAADLAADQARYEASRARVQPYKPEDHDAKIFDLIAQKNTARAEHAVAAKVDENGPEALGALERMVALEGRIARIEPRTVRGYAAMIVAVIGEDTMTEAANDLVLKAEMFSGLKC